MHDVEQQGHEFLAQLGRGPAVLLLGQRHLAMESGRDPLLDEIGKKYGPGSLQSYTDMLQLGLAGDRETALAWIDERCRRLLPADNLRTIAAYPWSAVVTSAVDTVWPSAFRSPWRELQPVLDERHQPSDPRNRQRLHCFYLYGNVNSVELQQRVPLTPFELLKREQVAVALARRLPELVTPLGVLAVEAYDPSSDWLRLEHLAPILADLTPLQVHFFGADETLKENPLVCELVARELVTLHAASLASTLAEGIESGLIGAEPDHDEGSGHQIRLGASALRIPADIWKRLCDSTVILDDAILVQPKEISVDARYHDFRAFLGAGDGVPNWEGFARGFAFTRTFEPRLAEIVAKGLASPSTQDRPIVLHGPTGSGKTIALAALARQVRLGHRYPVIFVERGSTPPYSDLELFCEWAEHEGAPSTLIAWDGMLSPGDYQDALRYLSSKGRNAVVVGTSYRLPEAIEVKTHHVYAPPSLTATEREEFLTFLGGFESDLGAFLGQDKSMWGDAFLVALYRLLPPVRGVVRAGVSRELQHAERTMAQSVEAIHPEYRASNAMARALLEAGLIAPTELSTELNRQVGSELLDDFQHLTGLVMVPGRRGLHIPLELLLRSLGQAGFSHFMDLLNGVDIFRWYEDHRGNITIGARTRLEARLIAEARAGGPETEIALICELLLELRPDQGSPSGGPEVDFAVSLIRAVGPGAQDTLGVSPYFGTLANALREARLERGVIHPRLMLQEANLQRESARSGASAQVLGQGLDEAEATVAAALDLLPEHPRNRALRSQLLVELASTMAMKSRQSLKSHRPAPGDVMTLMSSLKEVVIHALDEDGANYHALDVWAWSTRDAIDGGILGEEQRIEALGDLMSAFQAVAIDELDPRQITPFHTRRFEMAEMIGDIAAAGNAAEALRARGSGAALFLRALKISGLACRDADAAYDPACISLAVDELDGDTELLWQDQRCLDLYLDLWWIANTGERLLTGERMRPALTREQWQRLLLIVTTLAEGESPRRSAVLLFLRALALFHLDRVSESLSAFKEVERHSAAVRTRRRVIRSYVASAPDGSARTYHGTIAWLDMDGRKGDLRVEELRTAIVFFTHDFRLDDPRVSLDVGAFHIAFNFLGPIADPVTVKGSR
jgi:hypothetical protein